MESGPREGWVLAPVRPRLLPAFGHLQTPPDTQCSRISNPCETFDKGHKIAQNIKYLAARVRLGGSPRNFHPIAGRREGVGGCALARLVQHLSLESFTER